MDKKQKALLLKELREMLAMYEEKRTDVADNINRLICIVEDGELWLLPKLYCEHRFVACEIPSGAMTVQYDTLTTQMSFEVLRSDGLGEDWVVPGEETYSD